MKIKPKVNATSRTKNRLRENPNCRIVRTERFRGQGVLNGRDCVLLEDSGWLGWLPLDELNISTE